MSTRKPSSAASFSASSPASARSTMSDCPVTPQKDYMTAFGALQAQYGMGGLPTPPLHQPKKATVTGTHRKWFEWPVSRGSSTVSLIDSAMRADMVQPPVSGVYSDRKG